MSALDPERSTWAAGNDVLNAVHAPEEFGITPFMMSDADSLTKHMCRRLFVLLGICNHNVFSPSKLLLLMGYERSHNSAEKKKATYFVQKYKQSLEEDGTQWMGQEYTVGQHGRMATGIVLGPRSRLGLCSAPDR